MFEGHRIGGLLLMGGVGKRFRSDTPKQFHRLSGKPIYLTTLEAFLLADIFDEIILSCHSDWVQIVEREIADLSLNIPVRIALGGSTRQESSYKGLVHFAKAPDIVVIHDAVRPFVSQEILKNNVLLAIKHGAVDTCIGSTDTIVQSSTGSRIEAIPNRSHYFRGQTPQSFSYPLILSAHEKTKLLDASDDCRLILELGHLVFIAKGDEHNIKITSELDLFLAEQLFRLKMKNAASKTTVSLCGKRIAVVGGTGGIGLAICQLIEEAGGKAIALSRKTSIPIDLRISSSIEQAFARVGMIDGLVNSAGVFLAGSLHTLSKEAIDEMIDVNLRGLILCCKLAQLKKGAHVINIASSSFAKGRKEAGIYSCSKAAVVNFTQSLAGERPDLLVHTVVPHRTKTAMREKVFPLEDPATLLEPMQVAETVVSLLSDHSTTGGLIEVRKKEGLKTHDLR